VSGLVTAPKRLCRYLSFVTCGTMEEGPDFWRGPDLLTLWAYATIRKT
jgi:hypothetical protein